MELGKIGSIQKIVCPHCGGLIEDIDTALLAEEGHAQCLTCKGLIKLPDTVITKIRNQKYVGTNIDISI